VPPVGLRKIGHIGITVRDLDRSIDFYTSVLGLRLTERFEYPEEEVGHGTAVAAGAFVRCDTTHHCLSLFQLKRDVATVDLAESRQIPVAGLHHIAFELDTPQQLLELYAAVEASGAQIVNARRGGPGNQPRFYATDPDGHLLEFYWGIDQIGWDGRARAYPPIEEIDLSAFDFEAFLAKREQDAADVTESGAV
jgi:catechol 2,3-dioxygenase-like lactoylglutathione lyase family enzyme